MISIFLGMGLTIVSAGQQAVSNSAAVKATLCEISKNPGAFNGKKLVIRAQYMTDHIERSLLLDESCNGSAVLPYLAKNAVGSEAFDEASNVMAPLHLDETISATFTGRFHYSVKPEMCMMRNQEVCRRSFEIEKVEDLVLTMTPSKNKK
jgi:hypothetical protein